MPESFDVFLSHNSKDKPAVRELGLALRARGLKVWLDEWELVPGRPWLATLERVLETIGCVAVLVGKDGLGPWEIPEMRACLGEFVSRELPVIPVLLPGAPAKPSLPLLLRQFTWVDLRLGLTYEGMDHLEWGITGKKPENPRAPVDHQPAAAREAEALKEAGQPFARSFTDISPVGAPEKSDRPVAPSESEDPKEGGQPFTEPLTGIRFLWIPGGRFQMGSNALPDEQPIHWVQLSPFWVGETQVTNGQYSVFLEKTKYTEPDYWRDKRFSSPEQPVVGVNWYDVRAFCAWLAKASGWEVTLPSEAQWEFAARGTDGREYPWGPERPNSTRSCFGLDYQKGQPTPAGSYPAGRGPFGTLDQAGNGWEWCRDAWDAKHYSKLAERSSEAVDPIAEVPQGDQEEKRVARGGGWLNPCDYLRAAFRKWYPAKRRDNDIGFRVVVIRHE